MKDHNQERKKIHINRTPHSPHPEQMDLADKEFRTVVTNITSIFKDLKGNSIMRRKMEVHKESSGTSRDEK